MLFSCCSTRAVHLDVATNYDTTSILHCICRLKALRGEIRVIVFDPGSQLVGACNEMKNWRHGWSEADLVQYGSENGIDWHFIMANSQHQNGGAEVMVKLAKGAMKSLLQELGSQVVTLNELNTILLEAANLINSRPIGLKPNKDTDSDFLTPNSLLLGRNCDVINAGLFQSKDKFDQGLKIDHDRFKLVQKMIGQFWSTWIKHYFPTLLVRKKWHFKQRNMQVGDICFLQDSNQVRGQFRRCRVSAVYPDKSNIVRNVEVLTVPKQDGSRVYHPQALSRMKRHVNNLILIQPADEPTYGGIQEETTDSNLNNTVSDHNSNFRNLVEAAPSEVVQECSQVVDDTVCDVQEDPSKGACQVPPQSGSQVLLESGQIEDKWSASLKLGSHGLSNAAGLGYSCKEVQDDAAGVGSICEEVQDPEELWAGV